MLTQSVIDLISRNGFIHRLAYALLHENVDTDTKTRGNENTMLTQSVNWIQSAGMDSSNAYLCRAQLKLRVAHLQFDRFKSVKP